MVSFFKTLARTTGLGNAIGLVEDFFFDSDGNFKNQPKVVRRARTQNPVVTDIEAALSTTAGFGLGAIGSVYHALANAADEVIRLDNTLPVGEVITDLPLDAVRTLAQLTRDFGRAERQLARQLRREASRKRQRRGN